MTPSPRGFDIFRDMNLDSCRAYLSHDVSIGPPTAALAFVVAMATHEMVEVHSGMAPIPSLMAAMSITVQAPVVTATPPGKGHLLGPARTEAVDNLPGRTITAVHSSRMCNVLPANGWVTWQNIVTCWQPPFA